MGAAKGWFEIFSEGVEPPGYAECCVAVDQLGFRVARDWLADQFFPGFASHLSRARYFFLIPWVFQEVERRGLWGRQFLAALREREVRLIEALIASDPNAAGIIGRDSREQLRVMPSAVYWRSLRLLGFCRFQGSLDEFARQLRRNQLGGSLPLFVEDEPVQCGGGVSIWSPGIPVPPSGFPGSVSLELSREEADDLSCRIQQLFPDSLSAALLRQSTKALPALRFWSSRIVELCDDRLRRLVGMACVLNHCRRGSALIAAGLAEPGMLRAGGAIHEVLEQWRQEASEEMPPATGECGLPALLSSAGLSARQSSLLTTWVSCVRRICAGEVGWEDSECQRLFQPIFEAGLALSPRPHGGVSLMRDERGDYRWTTSRSLLNEIIEHRSDGERSGP